MRIRWGKELWQFAYALGDGISVSQVPEYAGMKILPQLGGLVDPPSEFAFGDCCLQLKQHLSQRSTFCVGKSRATQQAAVDIGELSELQLATTDSILMALQSVKFELDADTLDKLVEVMTSASPLPQVEDLVEAHVHSPIRRVEDIESLHHPVKYQVALRTNKRLFLPNLQAQSPCWGSMGGVFVTVDGLKGV
ncbi:hypothetical protein ABBQ32_006390 [Trebouxia sp. C0010 RCD-2024]